MKKKFLQSIADKIIEKLETTNEKELFDFYYELGMWFDSFCVNTLKIYLD